VTADPKINVTWNNAVTGSGANRIFVEPCEAAWTCKVMDGMGNGVCTNTSWVTLYTMNSTGGWTIPKTVTPGNPTQPTTSPYCGSFAFGHIPVNASGTYAYVYANMTLGSMPIEGYSGNDGGCTGCLPVAGAKGEAIWAHVLHAGRTATGCVVLDIPCADQIVMTASPTTILSGGYNSTVTAQLYKNGSAYFLSGVDIEFKINNTAYATLVGGSAAGVKTVKSDAQGKATVTIQSKDVSGVYVKVWANVTCNSLSNNTLISISGWATLSGYVTDTNQVGIPGAKVTLWPSAVYNATSAKWEHAATTASIDTYVKNNPQLSNSGATSPLGTYTFDHIPWGVYYVEANVTNLTATKTLTLWFAICYINTSSAYTNNIAVPNFVAPTPTTVATTTATTTATTVATTTVATTTAVATTTVPPTTTTTSPGFGALLALIGLGGVAYLVLRRRS
jgi:PGF-CTERM protein